MHYANPDRSTTGVPRKLWNLGVDWRLSDRHFLNVHFRGWTDNTGKVSSEPRFAAFGPERFLDAAYTFRDLFRPGLNLSLVGKNILDNRVAYPQAPHGGYILEGRATFGLQLSYRLQAK